MKDRPYRRRPHPALRGLVDAYVGYDDRPDPRAVHFGLPAPTATFLLAFDEPLDVGWADGRAERVRDWTIASGLHDRPALVRTHGHQHGIQLGLSPAGVRVLLGCPAAALSGVVAGGAQIRLPIDDDGHARIAEASSWRERYDLLDERLLAAAARADPGETPASLRMAWWLLARRHGRHRIETLAAEVGWSRRRLATAFTTEVGLSPKRVATVMRFHHAYRLAQSSGDTLAEVSVRCGYADQAHMSREWRRLAGRSPAATLAEPFPIVQDGDA